MSVKEKRQLSRYILTAPATIECEHSGWEDGCQFTLTRNLSGGGAYFNIPVPLQLDEVVKVKILLKVEKLGFAKLDGHVLVEAEGKVLRADSKGMAVKFNEMCQVLPVG